MKKKRPIPVAALTVLLAVLLFISLISICFSAGIRHQISPDGTRDMSERIDFYGAVAKGLSRDGITPEEWFTIQSDEDLLPRIHYTEYGLRGIADLPKFRSVLRAKAEEYIDDFHNESGRGKMRTEEFLELAEDLYDDFVKYLDFHMLDEDFKDLEDDLNERNLPQYDFSLLRDNYPIPVRIAKFVLSDPGFVSSAAFAFILAVLIILINHKYASDAFRGIGVPILFAGLVLLLVRGAIQLVTVFYLNQWAGLGTIILQALYILFSTILIGGLAAFVIGIVLCILSAAVSRKG